MPYVVTENCIRCKLTDCVEVCPVNCFYEGANMLVIHPDECIDCGVCESECPEDAIIPGSDINAPRWLPLNTEFSRKWPNIRERKKPPVDAKAFHGVEDKFERYFDPAAGEGQGSADHVE